MIPSDTVSSPTGTFHWSAAACSSIMRAAAPPWRTYSCDVRMPRLPPVPISRHTRLRARFWPGVMDSVVTFFQSHSSSSATSWARPVFVPWPISVRAMRITQVSSGLITTQALTSTPSFAVAACALEAASAGTWKPSARPPPAAAVVPTTKARRESFVLLELFVMADLPRSLGLVAIDRGGLATARHLGRHVDGGADALVGAAATDVGHRFVDVLIGRLRVLPQQRRCRHDLPGLTVAALRHIDRGPGLLHRVRACGRQALDGDDLVARLDGTDRDRTRSHDFAVDVYGAGTALRYAATILCAREADLLPDHP